MKISIEKRKAAGSKLSIRLAYYYGYTKNAEGKITHQRKFEKLDLFLYEKPKTPIEKQHNKDAIKLAETIQAKRVIEAESGKHGFNDKTKGKLNFITYLDDIHKEKQRTTSKSNSVSWDCAIKQFKKFHPNTTLLVEAITPELLKDFADYLKHISKQKTGKPLSQNTQNSYYKKITIATRQVYKKGYIGRDPTEDLKDLIKPLIKKREYLLLDSLKALAKTECRNDTLKRAFLFSCLTGLRWGDVTNLKWSDIQNDEGTHRIIFNQQKTGGLQYLDIPDQAFQLLGKRDSQSKVFRLNYSGYLNTELLRWSMQAGISKHITFHTGRHTFAVIQLMQGTPIYTVSKLMGHTDVKTTQIYADIVDSERKEAMSKIPDIGL